MNSKSVGTLSPLLALAALTAAVFVLPVRAVAQETVYDFSGSCSDCQDTGNGVLTLQDYTPGTALSASNFVSFIYASNLLTFTITQSELDYTVVECPPDSYGCTPGTVASGPISTGIGLSGALGATAGSADFYLNAANPEGNGGSSINFDSCSASSANCSGGLTSPGEWQVIATDTGSSNLPGGLGTKMDYGFGHTWTPVSSITAAPEMDAGSAAGAVTFLLAAVAVSRGRRRRSPTAMV